MADNRRRHPRVRAQGIVAHLRGPAGRYPCHVENISVGGLFVRTDRVLDVGTQLEIDLVRPGWKKGMTFFVRVTSRIDPLAGRFARIPPGMGVQFFGRMDEEHRERLLHLLRELGAPETPPAALEPAGLELPPLELEDEVPLESEVPLWQQVSMVEDANLGAPPLDASSFRDRREQPPAPARAAAPARPAPPPPRPAAPAARPVPPPPRPAPEAPARAAPDAPAAPQEAPAPRPAKAAPPVLAPSTTAEARLMLQIRGLLMELSNAQQQLTQRDLEIAQLKDELDSARAQLVALQPH